MRVIPAASCLTVVLVFAACEQARGPAPLEVELSFSQHVSSHNFGTALSGAEEVPPNDSKARGSAVLKLNKDGTELSYKLIVANIDNITQAHIHCGRAGENGPIIVWLYPSAPPAVLIPGTSNGILNEGTATNADVIARADSPQCPGGVADLDDVIEKLANGGAYANVHTVAFPPGEIRGQIEERGPTR